MRPIRDSVVLGDVSGRRAAVVVAQVERLEVRHESGARGALRGLAWGFGIGSAAGVAFALSPWAADRTSSNAGAYVVNGILFGGGLGGFLGTVIGSSYANTWWTEVPLQR